MFDVNAQLQRQKDTSDKHLHDLGKALTQATDKINKRNSEKMDGKKTIDR